jgi:hypothetical protein
MEGVQSMLTHIFSKNGVKIGLETDLFRLHAPTPKRESRHHLRRREMGRKFVLWALRGV